MTAGLSTETVVPSIPKMEGFGVNVWPATVNAFVVEGVGVKPKTLDSFL